MHQSNLGVRRRAPWPWLGAALLTVATALHAQQDDRPRLAASGQDSSLRLAASGQDGPLRLAASGQDDIGLRECLVEEPAEYRVEDFRTLTPCTLRGAEVVSTAALRRLLEGEAPPLLIDVMPSPRKPASLGADALWLPQPRDNIPGSTWLPNTGFGNLPVEEARYLRRALQRLRAALPERGLVFYCEANCWMSWNAAKRAIEWGYDGVYWYPEGTDGWRDAGYELVAAEPQADD